MPVSCRSCMSQHLKTENKFICHILPLFAAKRMDISERDQTMLYKEELAEGEEIHKAERFTCLPSAWAIKAVPIWKAVEKTCPLKSIHHDRCVFFHLLCLLSVIILYCRACQADSNWAHLTLPSCPEEEGALVGKLRAARASTSHSRHRCVSDWHVGSALHG